MRNLIPLFWLDFYGNEFAEAFLAHNHNNCLVEHCNQQHHASARELFPPTMFTMRPPTPEIHLTP